MANPWEIDWKSQAPVPAAPAAATGDEPWAVDWGAQKEPTLASEAKAVGGGLIRGVAAIPGLPGDVTQLVKGAAEKVLPEPAPDDGQEHLGWLDKTFPNAMKRIREEHEKFQKLPSAQVGHGDVPGSYEPPTTAQLMSSVEKMTGPLPDAQTAPGGYAQTIAQFAPSALILGPEKGIQGAVSNLGKLAVAPGAGSEFLGQKTEGTWLEPYARLAGALGGGVIGAGAGKGVEALQNRGAASKAAAAAGGDVPPAALAKVAQNYQADALNPAAVAARQDALGPEAMMLDMGRQLQGRAEAIASQPGKGQNQVLDAVQGRVHGYDEFGNAKNEFGEGTATRIKDDLDKTMGPSPDLVQTKQHINDIVDQYASPLYQKVMAANPVVDVPASVTNRPVIAQAMNDAVKLAKNHGETIDATAQPSLKYWDYVKKAVDSRINGMMRSGGIQDLDSAGKADLGGLLAAKNALVNHLDNATGGAYATARKASANKFEINDAIDFGRNGVLNNKLLPEELADHIHGMSIPEQAGVKAGLRREIDRIIDTARNDGAAARRILDTNQNKEKIAHIFGQDAADAIEKRISAETKFQGTAGNVAGNSRTAVRQQLMKDTEPASQAGPPMANIGGALLAAGRRGQQYLGDMSLDRTRQGIANLLTRQGQDIPTLAKILSEYGAAKARNAGAPVGQQARGLAGVIATQAPGWLQQE